jgi:hypothetical protein
MLYVLNERGSKGPLFMPVKPNALDNSQDDHKISWTVIKSAFSADSGYLQRDMGKTPGRIVYADLAAMRNVMRDQKGLIAKLEQQIKRGEVKTPAVVAAPELQERLSVKATIARTPQKTIKAYKLFRTLKTKPGQLFPLFIGKTEPVPVGEWIAAEHIPTKGFAPRPGWHAGANPSAPHLRSIQTGMIDADRVWAEIEMPADVDWQSIADQNKTSKKTRGDIRDRVPEDGHYAFNTSKADGQGAQNPNWAWLIGGAIKVNRVLSNDEVASILTQAGMESEVQYETQENAVVFAPLSKVMKNSPARAWDGLSEAENAFIAEHYAQYREPRSLKDRITDLRRDGLKRLAMGIFDQYARIKDYSSHAYMLTRMTASADGALEAVLTEGRIQRLRSEGVSAMKTRDGGFIVKMNEIIPGEIDQMLTWVAAERSKKLFAAGKEHLFKNPADIQKAIDLASRGNLPDGTLRLDAYKKALKVYQDFNNDILDIAQEAGLINAADRKVWQEDMYVPFYRILDDQGFTGPKNVSGMVGQIAFKKLKGGTEAHDDLMKNVLRNWSHLLSASYKNHAAVETLQAAERAGAASKFKKTFPGQIVPSPKDGAVKVMVDGKEVTYVVGDDMLLTALTAVQGSYMGGPLVQLMAKPKKWITMGTTISPIFKVRNLIRDSISSVGLSGVDYNILMNLKQGWAGTAKGSITSQDMLVSGGALRMGSFLEDDRAEHIRRLIKEGMDPAHVLDSADKVKNFIGKGWDAWQDLGDRSENINRAALYQQMLAQGMTTLEAAYLSRDLMDFSLQGSSTLIRNLAIMVPFFNARLQGLYKLGRASKEDPARMGIVLTAVAMMSVALLAANGDDDEFRKMADWKRDGFWWVKAGGHWLAIPKPFEIGAFGSIVERMAEAAFVNPEMKGTDVLRRIGSIFWDNLSMNPTPQAFKPVIDIYANKDMFTGRDIESQSLEKLSKGERMTANTSTVAELLGKSNTAVLEAVTGNSKAGLSPVQIDHLIRGYGGWLGAMSMQTADSMIKPMLGRNETYAQKTMSSGVPLVGPLMDDTVNAFIKEMPSNESKYVQSFYDTSKKINELMADIKHYREQGDFAKVKDLMSENKDLMAMKGPYQQTARQLTAVNARIRQVQGSNMPAETKRTIIDQQMTMRNALVGRLEKARLVREAA